MKTDITYCDYACSCENCERHLANLEGEGLTLDEWEHVSMTQFPDCPNYGSTAGMHVPM